MQLFMVLLGALALGTPALAADPESPDTELRVTAPHARLGVQIVELTPELRAHFGAPADRGVLVSRVDAGGAAERAGVQVGDLLTSLGGVPLTRTWQLIQQVHEVAGGEAELELIREGRARTVTVSIEQVQVELWAEETAQTLEQGMRQMLQAFEQEFDAPRLSEEAAQDLERQIRELEAEVRRLGEELRRQEDDEAQR